MKCKQSKFDRWHSECICQRYGKPTRVCCATCREPDYETDPGKW